MSAIDTSYPDDTKHEDGVLGPAQMQAQAGRGFGEGTTLAETAEQLGVDERKLVRKLDMYLIPFVMLSYLLSFLDRYAVLLFLLVTVLYFS